MGLEREAGQLDPEGRGLGMDAVRTTDGQGVACAREPSRRARPPAPVSRAGSAPPAALI